MSRTSEPPAFLDPRTVLTSISHVVYDWRLDDDTIRWGANAVEVLGVPDLATIGTGRDFARLVDPEAWGARLDAITNAAEADAGPGVPFQVRYPFRPTARRGAGTVWIEDTGRWFAADDGRPVRAHGMMRLMVDSRDRGDRAAHGAALDDLTGQLNRARLTDVLEGLIEDARRVRRSVGFLIVGIDGLAAINDTYGFAVADEVIAGVARRIRSRMRSGDALGRYSGNKFGVVVANCVTEDLPVAAARFAEAVTEAPLATSVGPVGARVSIGGTLAPRYASSALDAMMRAQEAFDLCRATRRGGFMAYAPSAARDDTRRENARITDEVVGALNERRLAIGYQPIVDARTGVPAHYECLLRLRARDGRDLPASTIIPITEKLGLVRLIDHRVLELAVDSLGRTPSLHLAINLSAVTVADQDWLAALALHLHRRQDLAERLTVEITESAAISDLAAMARFVRQMKEYGVKVAIDDFGSGHTSFRALRDLAVDMVKIDGVFVENMSRSADDRFFVRTLIDLARHLGLKVVAEWVQDETTARQLRDWGCDYLQGSLYGMATPALSDTGRDQRAAG